MTSRSTCTVLYIADSKFLILLDVILMILLNNKVLDCSNKKNNNNNNKNYKIKINIKDLIYY